LTSLPAGGGGGGQDPVLHRLGVTGRLVSGYSLPPPAPPTLARILDHAGDGARMSFALLCNATY